MSRRTVSENEFRDTSNVHCNATEEVIVATQSNKRLRCHGSLEAAQN
jgi:hypothetical protein